MDRPRSVVLNCGHSNLCVDCVNRLPTQFCPVCRTAISTVTVTPNCSSYQRDIHLLPQTPVRSRSQPLPRPQRPQPSRIKTVLFIGPRGVPLDSLLRSLRRMHPPRRGVSAVGSDSVEISVNDRVVKLVAWTDDGVGAAEMIQRVRPKLVVMCCCKGSIGTFERMVRSDLELLQRGWRSAPMIWALLERRSCRKRMHAVEKSDLKAAWHYLGKQRLAVNVGLDSYGSDGLSRLVNVIGFYAASSSPNSSVLTNNNRSQNRKGLFRSLLCL